MPSTRTTATGLLAAALLTACGGSETPRNSEASGASTSGTSTASASPTASPTESPSAATSSPAAGSGLVVTTGPSDFGTMLFDRSDQAIYLFDKERSSTARCYGECAGAWPPVLTDGAPQADGRVRGALLGTTERRDGSLQVTYAGHPLYYYAHEGPGQVLCHDVVEYGGTWLVVTPAGDAAPA